MPHDEGDPERSLQSDAAIPGRLVLAGTPMGDPGDASQRLRDALGAADVVAAEDTRRTRTLARALGVQITGRGGSFYDHVETARMPALLADIAAGATVLLVTDAGMPSVSDPGYRLVAACVAAGSARDVPARTVGGHDRARVVRPAGRSGSASTASRRASPASADLAGGAAHRARARPCSSRRRTGSRTAWPTPSRCSVRERRAAVCRELTKTYEEVRRGTLGELAAWAAEGVRGEITVVLAGAEPETVDAESLVERVERLVAARPAAQRRLRRGRFAVGSARRSCTTRCSPRGLTEPHPPAVITSKWPLRPRADSCGGCNSVVDLRVVGRVLGPVF